MNQQPVQSDYLKRVVALANLEAICEAASGTTHTYEVVKVSKSRVYVEYSNPDEWGNPHPMQAVFPCYKGDFDTVYVVLDIVAMVYSKDSEDWQYFHSIIDSPVLWRKPQKIATDPVVWEHGTPESEIRFALLPAICALDRGVHKENPKVKPILEDLKAKYMESTK